MFSPEEIKEAYFKYRKSIGRDLPPVADLKNSIPYAHFIAGVEWATNQVQLSQLHGWKNPQEKNKHLDEIMENAEDAL